jgi:hypothetical protein
MDDTPDVERFVGRVEGKRSTGALKPLRASIRAFILIFRHRGFEIVLGGMQRREFGSAVIVTFAVGHAPSVLAQRTGNVAPGRIVMVERIAAFVGIASRPAAAQRQDNSANDGSRPNRHFRPHISLSCTTLALSEWRGDSVRATQTSTATCESASTKCQAASFSRCGRHPRCAAGGTKTVRNICFRAIVERSRRWSPACHPDPSPQSRERNKKEKRKKGGETPTDA